MAATKKLYRSSEDRHIAGVCGGLAEYFEIDSSIVRLLFVLFALTGGPGLLIYIILAIVVPEEPVEKSKHVSEQDTIAV